MSWVRIIYKNGVIIDLESPGDFAVSKGRLEPALDQPLREGRRIAAARYQASASDGLDTIDSPKAAYPIYRWR